MAYTEAFSTFTIIHHCCLASSPGPSHAGESLVHTVCAFV